ncbi:DnaJ domain-containing protein [Candidatus Poribacteria bacterium]|nr:DnaJ domain-containing protein [Candidatus Poribacteria bacterium]
MTEKLNTFLLHCIVETTKFENEYISIPETIHSINYKDLTTITRKIDPAIAEQPGMHEAELKVLLASYQQININIFQNLTILPLRFGIMVDQEEQVEEFMANSYIHIKWALNNLRNKAEFAVQLFWDLDTVLQNISKDENWLKEAVKSIDINDKIQLGKLLFQSAEKLKRQIIDSIHDKLSNVSIDSSEGRSADDSIIFNRSYLINRQDEAEFDKAMEELGNENESYLSFKYIGPIPPYSFAPLEFKKGNYELIDKARRRLELPEKAHLDDIKASYRRLALKYHPDKTDGDKESYKLFKEIDEAYKILESYCHSYSSSLEDGKNAVFSFSRDEVEKVFIAERLLIR